MSPVAEVDQQKTTLYLEGSLHRSAKVAAAEDGVSLTAMVEEAIREHLDRRKKSKR